MADLPAALSVPESNLDLSACEEERIDAPGAIQDHGQLIAIDPVSLRAVAVSKAAGANEGESAGHLIGHGIDAVADWIGVADGKALAAALDDLSDRAKAGPVQPEVFRATAEATVILSAGIGCLLIEYRYEPTEWDLSPEAAATVLKGLDARLKTAPDNVFSLAEPTAGAVRELIGFDRVLVYRFAPDWHGEVIAEARAKDMVSYLGLHYPATDIPARARRLYVDNRVREIGDTLSRPLLLTPDAHAEALRPIDLSTAVLRSVSPYHLEYMANMGIRGTLVSSIIVEGELWGLIACHHRAPKIVPWKIRATFEAMTIRLARALEDLQAKDRQRCTRRAEQVGAKLRALIQEPQPNLQHFLNGFSTATKSDGIMLVVGDSSLGLGNTPPADLLFDLAKSLVAHWRDRQGPSAIVSDHLVEIWPKGAEFGDVAAGIAAIVVSSDPPIVLGAFRQEWAREVKWGGDPTRPAEFDAKTGRLSPRRSFDVWRQNARYQCRPWGNDVHHFLRLLSEDLDIVNFIIRSNGQIGTLIDALGETAILHSAILNVSLDGKLFTSETDQDSRVVILSMNRELEHQFRLTATDIKECTLDDLADKLGTSSFSDLNPGQSRELTAWSPDFGNRVLHIYRKNVLDSSLAGNRVVWSVYVFQDITESRRNEDALVVARDQAIAESRAKSEFLANMSHELRTPLNAILGYAELIESGVFANGPAGKTEESARSIATAGHRLLTLIEDLLEVSQLDAGRRHLREGPMDLTAIVSEAVDWCSRDARFNDIPFVFSTPNGTVPFFGDSNAISRIAINLINNAAKFSESGSPVTVTLSVRADGCPLLTVADRGPGIEPDLIGALFRPFVQGEKAYARRHGGAGLGLAISKNLVELHGGSIRLNSSLGEGTEVIVQFPSHRVIHGNNKTAVDNA